MQATFLLFCALWFPAFTKDLVEEHIKERNLLLNKDYGMMLGSDIVLNNREEKANNIIMELKNKIIDEGFENPHYFNFSKHFFSYKDEVKDTPLFKILREMPKGALLHGHDTGMLSPDYLLNITYWDHLYVCFQGAKVEFMFSKTRPNSACGTKWQLMSEARLSSGDVQLFDSELRKHFTMVIDNPHEVYTDINTVWVHFSEYFIVTGPLLTYKAAWEYYFYETLRESRADNIMYIEIRSVLPELYDLEGNIYDTIATAESYKKVLDNFMADYPDFIGAKLVYAPVRSVDNNTVEGYIKIAKQIKQRFPDFLAGFDMVGQEDLGRPTKDFLPLLTQAAGKIDFIFHAGETNWYGTSSDENLVDAILLGSRRLGHAYALTKHPGLMDEVKKRDIAVEVNVVSNAVLCLVSDVRNHPLATFLARAMPVVISSDDPGVWEADMLTHDFFVTFVGVASQRADLRLLKKLALNSLYYSTISNKDEVIQQFEVRWSKFIDQLLKDY